jgi:Ca2+-binding EF-hand superfamily protein
LNRKGIYLYTAIAISASGIVTTESANAQGLRGSAVPTKLFKRADADHDGVVSRDEYQAARGAKFDELDRSDDGYLTDADFPRLSRGHGARADKAREMLQKPDSDQDGRVSREEYSNAGSPIFDLADANEDGVVDKPELRQAAERLKAVRQR